MGFDVDFSLLNLVGDPDGITLAEIISITNNERSRLIELEGYPKEEFYTIEAGYSNKKRILLIASRIVAEKRQMLQVKVANEEEIETYYCQG